MRGRDGETSLTLCQQSQVGVWLMIAYGDEPWRKNWGTTRMIAMTRKAKDGSDRTISQPSLPPHMCLLTHGAQRPLIHYFGKVLLSLDRMNGGLTDPLSIIHHPLCSLPIVGYQLKETEKTFTEEMPQESTHKTRATLFCIASVLTSARCPVFDLLVYLPSLKDSNRSEPRPRCQFATRCLDPKGVTHQFSLSFVYNFYLESTERSKGSSLQTLTLVSQPASGLKF